MLEALLVWKPDRPIRPTVIVVGLYGWPFCRGKILIRTMPYVCYGTAGIGIV